ncbi:MAG: SAM-dependent methyltransferase [Ignavibacteria bacterium]|jgi:siroheme synthase
MEKQELHPILIVGTGPGDPELLTVRAHKAISSADIILYDCMPAHYVLNVKRDDAEVVFLSKQHDAPREDLKLHDTNVIDHLEKYYKQGKKVVRLKAGDAFMYGSGGRETVMLIKRGIPFDVIPGLTAGAAAANLYGVKISEKDETDLVMYYIGFDIRDEYYQVGEMAKLLKVGATLVLYMADDNFDKITEVLKSRGVPGTIPAVVVGMASLPDEDCAVATLDTIVKETEKKEMVMPFTYFIGKYVDATITERTKMQRKPFVIEN